MTYQVIARRYAKFRAYRRDLTFNIGLTIAAVLRDPRFVDVSEAYGFGILYRSKLLM